MAAVLSPEPGLRLDVSELLDVEYRRMRVSWRTMASCMSNGYLRYMLCLCIYMAMLMVAEYASGPGREGTVKPTRGSVMTIQLEGQEVVSLLRHFTTNE